MEFIIEFLLELALEGSIEACKDTRVPKYIRYPLVALLVLFFIAVIGLIFFVGILLLKDSILAGTVICLLGIIMLVSAILKFRRTYLFKTKRK